jgi:hypothetical protein
MAKQPKRHATPEDLRAALDLLRRAKGYVGKISTIGAQQLSAEIAQYLASRSREDGEE